MFYRYLQVRHALQSQFGSSIPRLVVMIWADLILGDDPKKLISTLYNHLLSPSATTHTYQLKAKWETDIGEIDNEQWGKYWRPVQKYLLNYQIGSPIFTSSIDLTLPLHEYLSINRTLTQPVPDVVALLVLFIISYGLAHLFSAIGHK